ncbi:MAG TPA: TolC family protein [Gemmatimonadota bacterium]
MTLPPAFPILPSVTLRAQGVRETPVLSTADARELTIGEAVGIGIEENPAIRAARFRRAATGAGLLEAWGNFLPELNLDAFLQKSGRGEFVVGGVAFQSPESYTTYYQFVLSHRLFDAGRDFLRLGAARAERRAADAQVDEDRLRTAAAVRRRYVEALTAQSLGEQAGREILARRRRLDLAQARFDLGEVTRSDVLQARIAVSQAEVELARQREEAGRAKLELLREMGVHADADSIELVARLEPFEPELDADALVRASLATHPALRRLRGETDVRRSEHGIAKTAYLPTLQAGITWSSTADDTTEFLFSDFNDRSVYSLSLTWELFGGFTRHAGTSRAKAEVRASEEAVRAAELEVEAAVRAAVLAVETAYARRLAQAEEVELAREQLDLAQERYRIGSLSFPDLTDAQVTFAAAETAAIGSVHDFFLALAALEEASAQPVFPEDRP